MANKVNLAALRSTTERKENMLQQVSLHSHKDGKEKRRWSCNKKEKGEGTRSIKFNRTAPNKIVAFFLWFLLLGMGFFWVLSVFISGNTLSNISSLKRSVAQLQNIQKQEKKPDDFVIYQGKSFLYWYFLVPKTSQEKEDRTIWLGNYLANGLTVPTMEFGQETKVLDIQFTRQKVKENKLYNQVTYLSYEVILQTKTVSLEEEKESKEDQKDQSVINQAPLKEEKILLQVVVPVTVADGDFRVIDLPEITSFGKNNNLTKDKIVPYAGTALYDRGEKVTKELQPVMVDFLIKFYKMYTSNDEKLSIVTHESGFPTSAEAKNISIRNLVRTGKNQYKANGTAEIFFTTSGIHLSTSFTITFKQEGNSYFVQTVNN